MKLNKTIKKFIAVVCSLAMVVTSITVYNTTAKAADVEDVIVTAAKETDDRGGIRATWKNPEGTAQVNSYLNVAGEEDLADSSQARADNDHIWSSGVHSSVDHVVTTRGRDISVKDGGAFVIVVVCYDENGEVIGKGTSEPLAFEEYVNYDLGLKKDRGDAADVTTYLVWTPVSGAARYVTYLVDGGNETQLSAENNGGATWTSFTTPTGEGTYEVIVRVYDVDGGEITVTNNTLTLPKYTTAPEETEKKPEEQDTFNTEGLEWETLGTSGSGVVENKYFINSDHGLSKGVWYKIYAPHSDAAYHNERDNCKLGDRAAFVFQASNIKSIWINGERYANDDVQEYINNKGDCTEIATELFDNDVNVVTLVYKDGSTTTFAIKVEKPEEFVQPKIDPDTIDDWTALAGTSDEGAKAYVSTAIVETFGNVGLRGFYAAGTSANWNISDAMKGVPVFGFVTSGGDATKVVITDTTDLSNPVELYNDYAKDAEATNAYIGNDCVYINQNLLTAGVGETKYYTITALDSSVGDGKGNFLLKVVGPNPVTMYTVTVDGAEVAQVAEGATYTLPTDAQYGYFEGDNLYKAGATITVNSDVSLTSLNSVSVTMANGAVVKNVAPAGIAFQATVAVNGGADLADASFVSEGMLITANDLFVELGGSELTLESAYTYKNVTNEGWFDGTTGTYRAGITNVSEDNYIRKFIARGYVQLTYTDGTKVEVYSEMSPVRSIQQVAQAAIGAGQGNEFLQSCAAAE